ncbi:MAG TPA: TolC family protein [Gemmatimonadaceae bacterium]
MRISAFLLVAASSAALAQDQPVAQPQGTGPILTLEEAVQLAIRNNPAHLQSLSARNRAGASVRSAYGAFLPSVSSSFTGSFRKGGSEVFQGQQFGAESDRVSSQYSIGVSAGYNVRSLLQPGVAKANLNASEADVTRSAALTRATVVTQYLNVLQAQATAALQDTLLANAQAQLELNRAREQVGATTSLEVRRSEVAVGLARVAQLRERNNVQNQMQRLFQEMGIDRVEGVRLTTTFPITAPTVQLNELLEMARRANPALLAAEARQNAAEASVRQARGSYLPTLSLSTGWSGNTLQDTDIEPAIAQAQLSTEAQRRSCLTSDSIRVGAGLSARGCDQFVFTDADAAAMRARNDQFPFNFNKSPFGYSVTVSLPIFNGFQREEQIQAATSQRNDARYAVRAQQLQMTTEVSTAHRNLLMQYETVQLQEQNRATAEQALQLAQERYRVGASTFVDVTQARADFERASTDHINAIFEFHKAYAELERAVGRPLR